MAEASRVFLGEHHLPDVSAARLSLLARRLSAAADELRRDGADVYVLGSAAVPEDEVLLSLVVAPSAKVVAHAAAQAGLTEGRIVPAFWRSEPAQ